MTDYAADAGPKKQKNGLTKAEEADLLKEARARMKRAMEADKEDRERARKEMRFVWNVDNCQWDDEAKKVRKKRPMLTENRNPSFIRQATNEVRRSRPQVRALPVDDQSDPFTAEVIEGLIRNMEANSRADMAYDLSTDCATYCGRGYWKITTEYQGDGFDQDIVIVPVPDPFSIVDDPDCVFPDKSDRKFAFECEKVDRDEFEAQYGVKPATFKEASDALKDEVGYWADEKNVVVANYWRVKTDKTRLYLMSDGAKVPDVAAYLKDLTEQHKRMAALQVPGMILPPPILPEVKAEREFVKRRVEWYCVSGTRAFSKGEWAGQYIPLVYNTCEQMKIDGSYRTKGMTFDSHDLSKANNYLLSAQIENIALTPKIPFVGAKGSFESDRVKWNAVNTENHAYIEYDVVDAEGKPLPPPQRSMGATAQPEIAQIRMGVIDGQRSVVGLMGASMGDSGPEVAFKAIEARQTRGDTAIFHVMDNTVRAVRYSGMVIVDLIPKVYDAARVVRIINPKGEAVMQAINRMYNDPETGEARQVNFASGKYDIAVSAGPAFETQRQRDNALMVDLAAKIPQMGVVAPDLIAKRLIPGSDGEELAQRLAKTIDPAILGEAPPPQVQQLQQQVQQMQQEAHQTQMEKDFAESELAKQKGLVEKAGIENQTKQIDLQKTIAQLHGELQSAHLDVQKKDLEVQKAELALARAAMPAPPPVAPMQ